MSLLPGPPPPCPALGRSALRPFRQHKGRHRGGLLSRALLLWLLSLSGRNGTRHLWVFHILSKDSRVKFDKDWMDY